MPGHRVAKTSRLIFGLTLCALIIGCSAQASQRPESANDVASESASASPNATAPGPSIDEQIAILTGRSDADLIPIEGAQAWLGGSGLEAYVDKITHDEFIVDLSRQMVLAYDLGTNIYQEPIDLPAYPGEPPREQIIDLADSSAREQVPERDISTMRRTAWRRVLGSDPAGDTLEYHVMYLRYSNGAEVPEFANVTITLPTWDWAPSISAYEGTQPYKTPPPPRVTMLEALETAARQANFAEWKVKRAVLKVWGSSYFWSFELENLDVPEGFVGGDAAWINVDALTGECIQESDL